MTAALCWTNCGNEGTITHNESYGWPSQGRNCHIEHKEHCNTFIPALVIQEQVMDWLQQPMSPHTAAKKMNCRFMCRHYLTHILIGCLALGSLIWGFVEACIISNPPEYEDFCDFNTQLVSTWIINGMWNICKVITI